MAVSVALALVLLLPGLGDTPFDDPGEGQHAEIAREILASGDWLTLRLNGVRYFDKPPLLYWLAAGAFAVLGGGEWVARLVPLGGAVLAAAATALLGARLLGPWAGLGAAGALLSSALFIVFGRYVRPETLFVAAIQWGLAGLLLGLAAPAESERRRVWLLVGCAGLAFASLAKDPLGLIGPLGAVALALVLGGRPGWRSARLPWAGLAVLVILGFGWYLVAAMLSPGFLWYTVVDNHVLNALRLRRFPDEDVPLSSAEFLAVSGLGAFPWIIPAGLQVIALARRRAWRDPAETPWVALALWTTGLVALFTLSPFKLPHYALPAYPAIALLAVRSWTERGPGDRALVGLHLALFAALAAGAFVVGMGDGRAFVDTVFSATDVYTRKEAEVGQASPLPPWSALGPLVMRAAMIFGGGALVLAWRVRGAGGAARLRRGPRHHAGRDAARDGGRRARHRGEGGGEDGGRPQAGDGTGRSPHPRGADRELRRARAVLGPAARSPRCPAQCPRHRRDLPGRGRDVLECPRPGPRVAVRPPRVPRDAARARAERRRIVAPRHRASAGGHERPLALQQCSPPGFATVAMSSVRLRDLRVLRYREPVRTQPVKQVRSGPS